MKHLVTSNGAAMNVMGHAGIWIRPDARCNGPGIYTQSSNGLKERRRRWIVGCGVVLLHIAILAFLARVSPRWTFPDEIESPVVLLDLTTVHAVRSVTIRPVAQQKPKLLMDEGRGERLQPSNAADGYEESAFDPPPPGPLIDWFAELDTVAKTQAPDLLADWRRKCHDAEMHGELLAGCVKVKTSDIWNTHRGLAEFLAIGKREANGHIFDNMNDPDRDRSSVPDIVALQAGARRPVPLAFDSRRGYFTH